MAPIAPAPAPAPRRVPAGGPLLTPVVARVIGFTVLGLYGAVSWGSLVDPPQGWALGLFVFVAAAAGAGLTRLGAARPLVRIASGTAIAVLLFAVGLLVAGVPLRFLQPALWDDLSAGISQGIEASPAVRVPYGGADDWVRIVLLLGAPLLLTLAALLSFWPRSGRLGFPITAAVALGAVAAIPMVQRESETPLLSGAVVAVLLLAFLTLDRVPRRAAPAAAGLVAVATVVGVIVAPALDPERPLIDYEGIAQSLSPEVGQRFSWNHRYGPMDWPRDGTEVLRVRAPRAAYWKASALSTFDGVRWLREDRTTRDESLDTEIARDRPDWRTRMQVTIRGMTSEEFIGAGTMLSVSKSPRQPVASGPGEFRVEDRPLRSGHTYEVESYVPRPDRRALAAAGAAYPAYLSDDLEMELPATSSGRPRAEVRFPPFASDDPLLATVDGQVVAGIDAARALRSSPYGRAYGLAQRLHEGAVTPYEYIRAVERHLADGFTYSESPPRSAIPIDSFLFVDRTGYCQQFSGAMALLLRMGGVPARVATGFSPGVFDDERREYVVRDLDAHSWVEVYIPQAGWVSFDPTPSGTPARSRSLGTRAGEPRAPGVDPGPESERGLGAPPTSGASGAGTGEGGGGVPLGLLAVLATIVIVTGGIAAAFARRRSLTRERAPVQTALSDLERALRRSGREVPPRMTLGALAERWAGTPGEPYVRALARARFAPPGPHVRAPSAAERAGLRRVLARRGGALGWLRAWWALPPF